MSTIHSQTIVYVYACAMCSRVLRRCIAKWETDFLRKSFVLVFIAAVSAGVIGAGSAYGHGFAGKRFFPSTLSTDDPFVMDELSLPTIASRKMPASDNEPATRETDYSLDFTKRITPNLGIEFGATYKRLSPEGGNTVSGFDNYSAGIKYRFYESDEHETLLSAGFDWDIGGTGTKRIAAESFSTITPALFFGKGFGDLPESLKYLRPFALTGLAGIAVPTQASATQVADDGSISIERHPHVLNWGLAVEYSIPYLQSFVEDVGLRGPFNRLIPVVEFAFATPLDRGGGATTGTVNPGIIWIGRYMQYGLEAVIPVNDHTGSSVGVIGQIHFFVDDIFPRTIGRPLFGN